MRKPKKLSRADRNIIWIETNLFVPEGPLVGKPLKLAEFQKDIIRSIYDNKSGTRRAIISIPRKNAKTTLCAALMILHLVGPEALPNSQLYSAARSREQASILYKLACKMILLSALLRPYVRMNDTNKTLAVPDIGAVYKALSKDASTAQGLSPVFVVHDELGQVRGNRDDLYDALETATGAQADPLTLVISTQAATDGDLFSMLIDDAKTGADPRTVLKLWECPTDVDPFSEEALRLAHPAWGVFGNQKEVRDMQRDAKRMPSKEAAFRNLILNQRIEVNSPFIAKTIWNENAGTPEDWRGKDLYIGLDLSETTDLTCMTLVHKNEDQSSYSVNPLFWLPDDGLIDKAKNDRVAYDIWRDNGTLLTIPGRVIDYAFVAKKLHEISLEANIIKIAFDRYNIKHFKKALLEVGFSEAWITDHFHDFGQGFVSMSPAIRSLETLILNQSLRHGGHPLLTWCMDNVKVVSDPAGNRKFVKHTATKKIDGAVCLAMVAGILSDYEASKPKAKSYLETEELIFL
ncbi:terminase large subunit [Cereibacter changlensis]|uniref:terminase large subunit n=1 Tax=Cereibacter changlensis TaxID=402884 RepID=UPI004033DD95